MNKANGKNFSIISVILPCLMAAGTLLLSACFNPYQGDGATITISLPDSISASARFLDDNTISQLVHTIKLHNGPGPDQERRSIKAGEKTSFTVIPGRWDITIEGYLGNDLISFGSRTVTVSYGRNDLIEIQMSLLDPLDPPAPVYKIITSWAELKAAIQAVPSGEAETFMLKPGGNWNADSTIDIDRDITLLAEGDVTILRDPVFNDSSGNFFNVILYPTSGTLTLGSSSGMTGTLTLNGNKGSIPPSGSSEPSLIRVNGYSDGSGGRLFMYNNTVLTNNRAYRGGGVQVSAGTFYMNGGTISHNKAESGGGGGGNGGGVSVEGGIFYMSGGSIEYNETPEIGGGGVYVGREGSFEMSGGIITDNSATISNEGDGVYVSGFSSVSPQFFNIKGDALISSNNEVYLSNPGGGNTFRPITITGNLSNNPAAHIRLYNYSSLSGQVILAGDSVLVSANRGRFQLDGAPAGSYIDTNGQLQP